MENFLSFLVTFSVCFIFIGIPTFFLHRKLKEIEAYVKKITKDLSEERKDA